MVPRRVLRGVVLAAGLLAAGTSEAAAHDGYQVQPGDSLSKIASTLEGAWSWQAIAEANADIIDDPDRIYPGQILTLPDDPETEVVAETSDSTVNASDSAVNGAVWDRLAQCESGGDWHINSGNGYYGGLQFSLRSWEWVGGSGYPHHASREEQIARAEILLERVGWGAWPACSRTLGLR